MPELQFDYNKLIENPNTQVWIALPTGTSIKAVLTSEISIGGSNEYTSPFEAGSGQQRLAGLANIGIAGLNAVSQKAANLLGGDNPLTIPTLGGKHILQTLKTWAGSSPLKLDLSIVIIATKNDDDVRETASALIQACYPELLSSQGKATKAAGGNQLLQDVEKGVTSILTAPMGYALKDITDVSKGAVGTILIQIGRWLKVPDLLITEANFTFSSAVLPSGNPLYASGTIGFEPYRQFTGEEIANILKGTNK